MTIERCPICHVARERGQPEKHLMMCVLRLALPPPKVECEHKWDFEKDKCAKCGATYEWAIDRVARDHINGKKMNSLERLKEAAEHPGSYINGPDIALALKVIEAALRLQDEHGLWQNSSWDALFKALATLTEDKP